MYVCLILCLAIIIMLRAREVIEFKLNSVFHLNCFSEGIRMMLILCVDWPGIYVANQMSLSLQVICNLLKNLFILQPNCFLVCLQLCHNSLFYSLWSRRFAGRFFSPHLYFFQKFNQSYLFFFFFFCASFVFHLEQDICVCLCTCVCARMLLSEWVLANLIKILLITNTEVFVLGI